MSTFDLVYPLACPSWAEVLLLLHSLTSPSAGAMSRMSLSVGAEIPQILHALDQGTVMIKFFKGKKKPEKRIFCLKTDTFEIMQFPMARGKHTQCEETSKEILPMFGVPRSIGPSL